MRTFLFGVCFLAVTSLASAQVVPVDNHIGPQQGVAIAFPGAAVSSDGLDAPSGYRVKATNLSGTVVQEWITSAEARSLNLSAAQLPAGGFTITVHPFNTAGEAPASNAVGPFGKPSIPPAVTGVTVTVVPNP